MIAPEQSEVPFVDPARWHRWIQAAEAAAGHSLDGDEARGADRYSLASAMVAFQAGWSAQRYVEWFKGAAYIYPEDRTPESPAHWAGASHQPGPEEIEGAVLVRAQPVDPVSTVADIVEQLSMIRARYRAAAAAHVDALSSLIAAERGEIGRVIDFCKAHNIRWEQFEHGTAIKDFVHHRAAVKALSEHGPTPALHPESEVGEVLLGYMQPGVAAVVGWRTKRIGVTAYLPDGQVDPTKVPVFVGAAELILSGQWQANQPIKQASGA